MCLLLARQRVAIRSGSSRRLIYFVNTQFRCGDSTDEDKSTRRIYLNWYSDAVVIVVAIGACDLHHLPASELNFDVQRDDEDDEDVS